MKTNSLPHVGCVAQLESLIVKKANKGELEIGPVAQWSTGEEIRVVGKWKSKGFWA